MSNIKYTKRASVVLASLIFMSGIGVTAYSVSADSISKEDVCTQNSHSEYGELNINFPNKQDTWHGEAEIGDWYIDEIYSWYPNKLGEQSGISPALDIFENEGNVLLSNKIDSTVKLKQANALGEPIKFNLQNYIKTVPGRTYVATLDITNCDKSLEGQNISLGLIDLGVLDSSGLTSIKNGKIQIKKFSQSDCETVALSLTTGSTDKYVAGVSSFIPHLKVGLLNPDVWQEIDSLFTSPEHCQLAKDVTYEKIDNIRKKVASVVDVQDKQSMNKVLQQAESLLK